jgi:hypothetical protein
MAFSDRRRGRRSVGALEGGRCGVLSVKPRGFHDGARRACGKDYSSIHLLTRIERRRNKKGTKIREKPSAHTRDRSSGTRWKKLGSFFLSVERSCSPGHGKALKSRFDSIARGGHKSGQWWVVSDPTMLKRPLKKKGATSNETKTGLRRASGSLFGRERRKCKQ